MSRVAIQRPDEATFGATTEREPSAAPPPPALAPVAGAQTQWELDHAEPRRVAYGPDEGAFGPGASPPSIPTTPAPGRSPVGLGLARLRLLVDGERWRETQREVETISGRILGGDLERLAVSVGDVEQEVGVENGTFNTSVRLAPGPNRVRIVGTSAGGARTEEMITLRYVPPAPINGLAITSPADGYTIAPGAPPVVVIEGRVDPAVAKVWLVTNSQRTPVEPTDGRFRQSVLVLEPTTQIRVETEPNGTPARTASVTVRAGSPTIGVLVKNWRDELAGEVEVSATWRPKPATLDGPRHAFPLGSVRLAESATASNFFYLRDPKPGAYTFVLRYGAQQPARAIQTVLYYPAGDRLTTRRLEALPLGGADRLVLLRVLLPHGVTWEQEDWFTGQSANLESITKFRLPEGVTWTEPRPKGVR